MNSTAVFQEMAVLLVLAAGVGVIGLILRQPLIVSFIITGILAGGDVLGLVNTPEYVQVLADIGIAVLLFLVGLKLDIQIIRNIGKVALATGIGQVAFTAGIGFVICLALGLDLLTSAYVAVALTFSSTIIIVKLLSDKRELDTLHGQIALGFLIVQDIAVVVAMVVLSAIGIGTADAHGANGGLLKLLGGGAAMLVVVGLFIRYLAEPLLRLVARMPELLLTFALAWAVLFATVGDFLGFGKELGGLLAGVSLASTSIREAIASRLASLRDFLLLFFFIGLGSRLDMDALGAQVPSAIVLSLFVLIGNPLIVMAIMGAMGYRKRTGFLAGLTVAQISEFSLVFIAMGLALNHVRDDAVGLVTLVGLVTITLSTYMILYSQRLYSLLEPWLGIFERRIPVKENGAREGALSGRYDVIVFGLGRFGSELTRLLKERGSIVLGVDYDPAAVGDARRSGLDVVYGEAEDPDLPLTLPLRHAHTAVIATPPIGAGVTHADGRLLLLANLRQAGFTGQIAVRCDDQADADRMVAKGADICLTTFADAAAEAVNKIVPPADQRQADDEAAGITTAEPERG